jgi:hypothetical protein
MTRPLRIEYAGAVYHITSRGNVKKAVFKDDQDRINFLNTLQHVNKRYNWDTVDSSRGGSAKKRSGGRLRDSPFWEKTISSRAWFLISGYTRMFLKFPRVTGMRTGRTSKKIFTEKIVADERKRDKKIVDAVQKYGYTQQQIATHLNMHYSTISNLVRGKA